MVSQKFLCTALLVLGGMAIANAEVAKHYAGPWDLGPHKHVGWIAFQGTPQELQDELSKLNIPDVNQIVFPREVTLAHAAVSNARAPEILAVLVEKGANLNVVDADARTPLRYAVDANRLTAAKALLKLGASLEFKNSFGSSVVDTCNQIASAFPKGVHETCDFVLTSIR